MSNTKALRAVLFVVFCLSSGWTNAAAPNSPAASKDGAFSPPPPEQNSTEAKADAVSESFERAAVRFAPFTQASPGERNAILRDGLPLLGAALKASDERLLRNSRAVDFRNLARIDGRFGEAWVWKDFRTVVSGNRQAKSGHLPLNTLVVYTNETGLPAALPPVASKSAPARVDQFSARTVGEAIAGGAELTKKAYDDMAFGNAVNSLLQAAMKSKDYSELLKLSPSDSLEEREKKIVVRSALEGLLGSVISYKESYFLAAERLSGQIEIWEFKQRVNMRVSREAADAKTRLNTGVELTTKLEFSHSEPSDLCRRYVGGYWGAWGEFPRVGEIEITKDENWNVEFKSSLPFRSFHRLSSVEVDQALLKSGTTKVIAAAEKKEEAENLSPEERLTLLGFYAARENYGKVHAMASEFLEAESLELPVAKRLATALLSELAFSRPAMGETVRSGVGFKHYDSMKGLNSEIGEMQRLPYPRRTEKGHFYGQGFDLSGCIKAFEHLSKADPLDADALFDLALLELFGTERFQKPRETGNEVREKSSAQHLTEAVVAASKSPPKSGRNFAKLITEEPTFIVLSGQETFEKLLGKLLQTDPNRASLTYGKRFQRHTDYLNAGY